MDGFNSKCMPSSPVQWQASSGTPFGTIRRTPVKCVRYRALVSLSDAFMWRGIVYWSILSNYGCAEHRMHLPRQVFPAVQTGLKKMLTISLSVTKVFDIGIVDWRKEGWIGWIWDRSVLARSTVLISVLGSKWIVGSTAVVVALLTISISFGSTLHTVQSLQKNSFHFLSEV